MNKLLLRLCQIYVLLVLLIATILSALPYSPLALALLAVMVFITLHPLPPRLNGVIIVATIFLVPLILAPNFYYLTYTTAFAPTIVPIIAAISILPAIYLLDDNLRQNTQNIGLFTKERAKGRHLTPVAKTLFAATLVILLVSLILNDYSLLFTDIIFALYLLAILMRVFLAIPRLPLDVPTTWKRVVAGTTVNISLYALSQASIRLYSLLNPVDSWVKVTPQRFTVNGAKTELNLTMTPPLAGPSHPQLWASVIDPWGFTQVNQLLEPLELHVIPRARYAEWLAIKYLEQTGAGIAGATKLPPKTLRMPKRGIEYFDSRIYQPGDQLRDIDWKHTLKLSQLIIKEYIEAGQPAAIIAVNLSVTDTEEADKLAFNLVTTALTLAHETIPTALAVYNHQRVVLTTAVIDPREILKHTLLLVKDITSVELARRYLELPDIGKLRRNITQLQQVTSEPAQRLLSMLNFEYQAIEKAAKNHPATLALLSATRHAPTPGIIVLVSQLNHDAEAVLVTTDKLSKKGFTTIPIETK